jgi:hypothetical protein
VVHQERRLDGAVVGLHPLVGEDAGVVDQHVEGAALIGEPLDQLRRALADRGQRAEIEGDALEQRLVGRRLPGPSGSAGLGAELRHRLVDARAAAPVHQHAPAGAGQLGGGLLADSIRRSGDERGPASIHMGAQSITDAPADSARRPR